ncbi:MAG: SDR family oxidoreductase [Bermanella sp.]
MQTLDYNDKVVMIINAGSGMGKLAAENFSRAGATLAICDANPAHIEALAARLREEGCEVLAMACDASDEKQVQAFSAECLHCFDRIDVAINSAVTLQEHSQPLDLAALDAQYQANIKGPFTCMKHQLSAMQEARGGVILNMSAQASVAGTANLAADSASKHALIAMTKSAALEYGRYGIRVNVLCPNEVEKSKSLATENTMPRPASLQEVVNAMLWLCSDYNSYMNGAVIPMDDGLTAI